MNLLSLVPFAMQQMEYYQAYELQKQEVITITDGSRVYENVLTMELLPYAYPTGEVKLRTKKGLVGNIVSYDTEGLVPRMTNSSMHPATVTLYFAKENELRPDLADGQLVVAKWVLGAGGYRVKGIMPLEEQNR